MRPNPQPPTPPVQNESESQRWHSASGAEKPDGTERVQTQQCGLLACVCVYEREATRLKSEREAAAAAAARGSLDLGESLFPVLITEA